LGGGVGRKKHVVIFVRVIGPGSYHQWINGPDWWYEPGPMTWVGCVAGPPRAAHAPRVIGPGWWDEPGPLTQFSGFFQTFCLPALFKFVFFFN
jgi:hypothetical protein